MKLKAGPEGGGDCSIFISGRGKGVALFLIQRVTLPQEDQERRLVHYYLLTIF